MEGDLRLLISQLKRKRREERDKIFQIFHFLRIRKCNKRNIYKSFFSEVIIILYALSIVFFTDIITIYLFKKKFFSGLKTTWNKIQITIRLCIH